MQAFDKGDFGAKDGKSAKTDSVKYVVDLFNALVDFFKFSVVDSSYYEINDGNDSSDEYEM